MKLKDMKEADIVLCKKFFADGETTNEIDAARIQKVANALRAGAVNPVDWLEYVRAYEVSA